MAATLAVATDGDRPLLAALLAHAFAFPVGDTDTWFARAGRDNVLAYRDGASLVGGLITIPMGQFFGGRSVPMTGLAGVGVAPEHRGGGTGAAMMTATLRLVRARGAALSALFPSTVPFYQSVGYERAGARFRAVVDARDLADAGRGAAAGDVVGPCPLDPDEELAALQRRLAAEHPGALDRGSYVWQRTVRPWRVEPVAFAVRRAGRLVGHAVVSHTSSGPCDTDVQVFDASALDAAAGRALFKLLGGYRSLAGKVSLHLHVPGLLQALLPDRRAAVSVADFWMLRIVDVEQAFATRGYRRGVRAAVDLAIVDEILPECGGAFRLRVQDGSAAVTRGGSGAVRLGPRGLAALYAGFATARDLARQGLLEAKEEDLDALDGIFTGPMPTMTEMF